jgi:enamine deaminase RidA (YjgF/YER057c/UK114 family)
MICSCIAVDLRRGRACRKRSALIIEPSSPFQGETDMPIKRLHAGPRMSQAVLHGGVAYLAGQVANNAKGKSVTEQTQDILAAIDGLLKEAGTDKSKLLTAQIWLTDMATFAQMNAVWDGWVSPGNTPARATVQSPALAAPGYDVEIMVTAAI